MRHLGEDDVHGLGIGYFGEVAEGPNGGLYQWVEGVDGLGNPMGFWKSLRKLGKRAFQAGLKVAPFIPGAGQAAAVLTQASPMLKRAGLLGEANIGQLSESLLSGFAADELNGFDADAELNGLDADAELNGFDADAELNGMDADAELNGFDADAELNGMDADELNGLGDEALQADGQDLTGYVRTPGTHGISSYRAEQKPRTPWVASATTPATPWKPLW